MINLKTFIKTTTSIFAGILSLAFILFAPLSLGLGPNFQNFNAHALEETGADFPEIYFFYSSTCPFCIEQKRFHETLLEKYPDLIINEFNISDRATSAILNEKAERVGAQRFVGLVPLTFIGDSFITGFASAQTTGRDIERALIANTPGMLSSAATCDGEEEFCEADFQDILGRNLIGDNSNYTILAQSGGFSRFNINPENLSLPALSILLGIFDGFNICSLGALMLILSLVLGFKSRKKVLLYGGMFLLITGITYASLIFIWFSLFRFLAPVIPIFEVLIGIIGLVAATLFLRQYYRFKKYGPTCEISDSKMINNAVKRLQDIFKNKKNTWASIVGVITFAFVVTVLEFPCSAVIPVAFAAILADAGITMTAQSMYLLLFMIFYLLDELIVFLIAVFTLRVWTGGNKMKTRLVLIQGIFFLGLALFYIGRFFIS